MKKQHRRPSGFHALSVADYHCKKARAQDQFDREIERNMRERQRLIRKLEALNSTPPGKRVQA